MKQLFTELNNRTLRFDGVSVLPPFELEQFILRGLTPRFLRATEQTPELEQFNANVPAADQIKILGDEPVSIDLRWNIPPKYLELNVAEHVLAVFGERLPALQYDSAQEELAITRVAQELEEFQTRGLNDMLRVIIFVLDRFRETQQVWGVGRGSSCASFVLFLLGLHVVDSIRFKVPLEEFFHD